MVYSTSSKLLAWLPPLYGLFAGLFIGKTIYAKRCVNKGPFLDAPHHA
jgi:hypothetical protein